MSVRTTCPYCGVGCGVIAHLDGIISGDADHPANRGKLCSKGAALAETLADTKRLRFPTIGGARASWDAALSLIARRFSEAIVAHGPDSVALYVSGQCLTEDYYVANKLMKGFMGGSNIDTNSRLCMASTVAGHTRAFGADLVPGVYADIDCADLIVLVGGNAAWCHPVLHQRIVAARAARGTRVVVIDPRRTASCEAADLHLQLAPGSDVALFAGLLAYLSVWDGLDHAWIEGHTSGFENALEVAGDMRPQRVAAITDLDLAEVLRFYDWFKETPRTVTLWSQGVNQSEAGTDTVNAILNCHLATGRIGKPGASPISLTGQPNAMGGREVGGLANQLAAHMSFSMPGDIDRVRRFWAAPAMAGKPGLKAIDLFEAVHQGRIKALWILATNPAGSLPRTGHVREALQACPFVVVSDCWSTETTHHAEVVLPAAGWGEKDGTVTNSERVISRQRAFRAAPGEARPDWWALAEVGRRMGWADAFGWETPAAVFREHAALSAFENDGSRVFDLGPLAELTDAEYDALAPTRWPPPPGPLPQGKGESECKPPPLAGGGWGRGAAQENDGRLFADGIFPTPSGRAHFIPTRWRRRTVAGELVLNTGRVRDQWHTMTRTGRVPRLLAHISEPAASFAPGDARRLGIVDRGLAELANAHGSLVLRATVDPGQRAGEVFVAIHWTDAFSSAGPVGQLLDATRDPLSGQPALKAGSVTARARDVLWRGLLLHRRAVRPRCGAVWSRLPLERGHALELTGHEPLPDDLRPFASETMQTPWKAEILELADPGRGAWRFAALVEGRLEACLFLTTSEAALPAREALAAMLGGPVAD
ncbi:MAG TPA: nitrate reductase, partial [Acetobacteraceae bacterium]|nr:nitrate reductase [Acetobacteraceae bacterium]